MKIRVLIAAVLVCLGSIGVERATAACPGQNCRSVAGAAVALCAGATYSPDAVRVARCIAGVNCSPASFMPIPPRFSELRESLKTFRTTSRLPGLPGQLPRRSLRRPRPPQAHLGHSGLPNCPLAPSPVERERTLERLGTLDPRRQARNIETPINAIRQRLSPFPRALRQ